jgi:Tol biopolymer transport system component
MIPSMKWLTTVAFTVALIVPTLVRAGGGETASAQREWEVRQVVFNVEEQWVKPDNSNGPATGGEERRASRIEIRMGDRLSKKKSVEGGWAPEWSANGDKIAFLGFCDGRVVCNQLWVMNADGTNRKALTGRRAGDFSIDWNSAILDLSWSPKEDRIAYTEMVLKPEKIVIISSDGSERREVSYDERAACAPTKPAWSPDGSAIAFTCIGKETAIVVVDKNGNNAHALVKGRDAVWSPDGKWLLFQYGPVKDNPNVSICIVGSDGKGVRGVFQDGFEIHDLTWLPDGKSVAFASNRENRKRSEIFQINVDGTGLRKIASSTVFSLGYSMFSPDGSKVVVDGYCCESFHERKWTDSDRSAAILFDLRTGEQRTIAKGSHARVLWELR